MLQRQPFLNVVRGKMGVCEIFHHENDITPKSVAHSRSSTHGDRDKIIKELIVEELIDVLSSIEEQNTKQIKFSISLSIWIYE